MVEIKSSEFLICFRESNLILRAVSNCTIENQHENGREKILDFAERLKWTGSPHSEQNE